MSDLIVCVPKSLPPHLVVAAAADAVKENPANRPGVLPAGVLTPQHVAGITTKFWKSSGVRLGVTFLDTSNQELKTKILAFMNGWAKYGNVQFLESRQGQVRLARQNDGYWSYTGVDILHVPANQPTMNLQAFSLSTPDSEYARVVYHETGHTLGFVHEQQRREIVTRIDPQRAIAYFMQMDGWDAQTTTQQVLTPLDDADLTESAPDRMSIMCYQLPASIMIDGVAVPGGIDIDATDARFCGDLYPLVVTPPPPPPPPPTGGGGAPAELWAVDAGGKVVGKYKPA